MMRLSIVIPLLNERENLPELHRRLTDALEPLDLERQIILVDDGSTDGSYEVIQELAEADHAVVGLRLSRNFGHELASTAGLDLADGDAAVLMDADLQDPPELIPRMIKLWKDGNQIVYATRRSRADESLAKRFTSWLFYRVLHTLSDTPVPKDTGDFRLMDARVLAAMRQCRERNRFVRGLVAWTGFRSCPISFDRAPRKAGRSKYHFVRLFLLSLDAFVGFSIAPLRLATALGFLVTLVSLIMVGVIVVQKLLHRIDQTGYALQTSALFFLGGVQLLVLGILGEYIGRIYRQTQNRPLYIVTEQTPPGRSRSVSRERARATTPAEGI